MKLKEILKEVVKSEVDKTIKERAMRNFEKIERAKDSAIRWIDLKIPINIVNSIADIEERWKRISDDLWVNEPSLWNKGYKFVKEKKEEVAKKLREVISWI